MHKELTAPRDSFLSRFRRRTILAAMALLLVAGWWAGNRRATTKDCDLRAGLLQQATAIARTIDPQLVKKLSFTDADKSNPFFQQLREQMAAYQPMARCRGIYTLASRSGKLVFGPESYAENDPMSSPPGTVYGRPTPQTRGIFSSGRAFTQGPCLDEYGTFVSAFTPVLDPRNGEVLMVIGLDIEAGDWQATLTREWSVAGVGALVLTAILIGGMVVLRWRDRLPADRQGRLRYAEVYCLAVFGLAATFAAALALHGEETRSQRSLFQQLAETQADRIEELFRNLRDDQLGALARFYAGSQKVEHGEFHTFTESIVKRSDIQALAWIPAIPAAEKGTLEAQARADGFAGFTVWQKGAGGQRETAAGREMFYPVREAEPLADNEAAVGFDQGSEPLRRAALTRALETSLPSATDPVAMVQDERKRAGILVFHPVFARGGQVTTLRGFALAVLRLDSLLQSALASFQVNNDASSVVDLYQLTSGQDPHFLASSVQWNAQQHAERRVSKEVVDLEDNHSSCVYPLFMFGKAYALLVQPGTEFVANRPMRAGWISALVGLLLTAVLTAFVTFLTRRHSDLETQVRDRTALMQESERRTRAITDAAYDAILTTDPDGRVSFWNPGAERIFGYAGHEALGQGLHALIVPPDYLETHHATFPDFRQTGQGALLGETVDVNALRKDGREIAIQLSLSSVLIGGAWHAMGIVRDVTEQKRNEEQLHKMFQVVEQTPVSVVITDLKGNIEYVNPAFEQTTGYTCPEALGKNPRILKSGLQPDDCYVQLWRELSAGREWRGEFQNRRKNGELYWELAVISPLKDASGKINHYMAIKENITVRKAMEDELRLAAQVDKLTGLPNRAMLTDRLQRAVLRSKRIRDYHFAVLFLDFDRFKIVNDSLGHDVGDLLLQEIGRRLQTLVRSGDVLNRTVRDHTAARMGGDEFVILLDGIASPQDATAVADRMMESFARPYLLGKHKVHSTASIGIVTSDMSAASADEVLRDADTAMYEAKLAGKGQYMVFDVSMRQRVQNLLILENDLRTAMETGQLFLMYQPIVSLQTGAIESFEGLVRWKHPERGLISPSEFIPIAEDTGLIVPIGEWVLREACRQFVRWQDTMGAAAPRSISVNLSRKQLALPNLPQTILGILDETGVTPECLHLEVTESAVMRDPALANQMLRSIKAIGVKLDMDDFGTGYSSLACLQEFPIDVLKIDRSFIANIGRGEDIAAVVYAVTQLARNLKIRVVAEGIETVEQLLMLQSLECEFGQGYLFSKPMLADQVTAFRVRPVILPGLAKELPAALAAG